MQAYKATDEVKLIDAEALIKKVEKINCVDYGSMFSYEAHNAAREVLQDIVTIISYAPAVDAAPVVHGRWEWDADGNTGHNIRRCSVCAMGSGWQTSYCPSCGAKMDGGRTGSSAPTEEGETAR